MFANTNTQSRRKLRDPNQNHAGYNIGTRRATSSKKNRRFGRVPCLSVFIPDEAPLSRSSGYPRFSAKRSPIGTARGSAHFLAIGKQCEWLTN